MVLLTKITVLYIRFPRIYSFAFLPFGQHIPAVLYFFTPFSIIYALESVLSLIFPVPWYSPN